MTDKKVMVAIGSHHDDVEIGAGGTIAKYIQNGWRVLYVVATTTPHYARTNEMKANYQFFTNKDTNIN